METKIIKTQYRPLIVQSDMTILFEVDCENYEEVRDAISPFAEIVKSPEHIHTYKITPLSLWNASSSGINCDKVIENLTKYSKYEIPQTLITQIEEISSRYGKVTLKKFTDDMLILTTENPLLLQRFMNNENIKTFFCDMIDDTSVLVKPIYRGVIKQALIKDGYPVVDFAGYGIGKSYDIGLSENNHFVMRDYQKEARDIFCHSGSSMGGSGVIVLPCGAGKTIVGLSIMSSIKTHTLILTTGISAIRQWKREILDKTNIREEDIGEYSGEAKHIKPITLTTYQIITHRKDKESEFLHFDKLNNNPWGLIIYDEVHLLPAQVFRFTSSLQSVRRLGLTATLIREDGREDDVFSLIGPKCFDSPWKVMEKQGWIARASCYEVRVPMDMDTTLKYATAKTVHRFKIAASNPKKHNIIDKIIYFHTGENILIIGQYIEQLEELQKEKGYPIITGKTANKKREELYQKFREGVIKVIIVSSVANFAIDLPDASVAIQISGKFGSRQEEAQRLGRILRPKSDRKQAHFYTVVTSDTEEQEYALNRQLFLIEQGYEYHITNNKNIDKVLENIKHDSQR